MSTTTIQQVFINFSDEYLRKYKPSYEQTKALNNIKDCHTERKGTRIYQCQECGQQVFSYNSCRDRHCPNCQSYRREKWIDQHQKDIINTPYFHIVMTVPTELHGIFYHNQKEMYSLLFKTTSETILELCEDKKYLGAKVGITAMLHTWSQQGRYHPHIHMIVTGGGINKLGEFIYSKDEYLLPVKVISKVFRGKLLSGIKKSKTLKYYNKYEYLNNKNNLKRYLRPLYDKDWVCYSKKPFRNVNSVYEYLARYAFRVCMSNDRIINVDEETVEFKYKDRKNEGKTKTTRIKGEEFIRRFMLHILPKSFMKVRYYGIMAGKGKSERLRIIKKLTKTAKNKKEQRTKLEILNKILGREVNKCEKCGGKLELVLTLQGIPPPKEYN